MKTKKIHGIGASHHESLNTAASLVTTVRTVLAVILAVLSIVQSDIVLLGAALAVYWAGDILDGIIARKTNRETQVGAVYDILSDRICVVLIYLGFAWFHPDMLIVIVAFLFNFVVIDGLLSVSFLLWGLLSPNYFYFVDKKIYLLNWSPAGKIINSSLFILATVVLQNVWLSALIVFLIYVVKLYSLAQLHSGPLQTVPQLPNAAVQRESDRRK